MQTIINLVEQAMQAALSIPLGPKISVYVSDFAEIKEPMPYVVIHCDSYAEEITPGCGIFKVMVQVMVRSHVKEDAPIVRDFAVEVIDEFMHEKNRENPASPRLQAAVTLSATPGIHNLYIHGFVPTSGSMRVNTDYKAYEYITNCEIYCMPSANS